MGARLLSFLSCRAYGKFGITAVMRLADAVRPTYAHENQPYASNNAGIVRAGGIGRVERSSAVRTGVDHDQKLHQTIVDVAGCCRLDDEDILVSYGLADGNTRLLVRIVQAHSLRDLYPQPVSPQPMVRRDMTTPARRLLPNSGHAGSRGNRGNKRETDRSATSRARMGWEFPLSSLISLDMVDMVEKKVVSGDAPFLHRSIYVPLRSYDCNCWSRALGLGRGLVCSAALLLCCSWIF